MRILALMMLASFFANGVSASTLDSSQATAARSAVIFDGQNTLAVSASVVKPIAISASARKPEASGAAAIQPAGRNSFPRASRGKFKLSPEAQDAIAGGAAGSLAFGSLIAAKAIFPLLLPIAGYVAAGYLFGLAGYGVYMMMKASKKTNIIDAILGVLKGLAVTVAGSAVGIAGALVPGPVGALALGAISLAGIATAVYNVKKIRDHRTP